MRLSLRKLLFAASGEAGARQPGDGTPLVLARVTFFFTQPATSTGRVEDYSGAAYTRHSLPRVPSDA